MTPVMDVPPPKVDFGKIAASSAALLRASAGLIKQNHNDISDEF
jgi:hypothetical protein